MAKKKKVVKKININKYTKIVKVKFKQAEMKVHQAIKKNPEKAALIATGIGVAIGAAATAAIIGRKKR